MREIDFKKGNISISVLRLKKEKTKQNKNKPYIDLLVNFDKSLPFLL